MFIYHPFICVPTIVLVLALQLNVWNVHHLFFVSISQEEHTYNTVFWVLSFQNLFSPVCTPDSLVWHNIYVYLFFHQVSWKRCCFVVWMMTLRSLVSVYFFCPCKLFYLFETQGTEDFSFNLLSLIVVLRHLDHSIFQVPGGLFQFTDSVILFLESFLGLQF